MNIDYLRVTVEHRGQVCELTVSGELDTCVADKFADAAMEAVGAAQGPVLVDLAGLEFMDVSGARSLAAVVRVITPRLAGLRSCRPPVRRVLELLGLDVDALSVDSARDFETRELIARSREISAYLASGVSNAGKVLDDLAGSYAYADSASDLPLLRAVGHPVAVDPDIALSRIARRSKWPVEAWHARPPVGPLLAGRESRALESSSR